MKPFINPTPHPDGVMDEHDFRICLMEAGGLEENSCYEMFPDDLSVHQPGQAGHHYGEGAVH